MASRARTKSLRGLITNGDVAGVQRAVQDDPALLNATVTSRKHSPLMWALHADSGGQPAIARWLVEQGAKLDLQTNAGWTALMIACRYGQPDTAQLLIEQGAKLDLQTDAGWTALMIACRHDQPDTAQLLIEQGAKLDLQNNDKTSALMFACRHDQPGTAQVLIERGVHLDLQDVKGWTALMCACNYHQPETAQLLIQRGANLDLQQPDGWTALMLASQPPSKPHHTAAGLLRSLKLCCAAGADLNLKNDEGKDALALAKRRNLADAVAFLEFTTMLEVARGVQDFDEQQSSLREKEQELIALQKAVKTDLNKISERDKTRRDLVAGIRNALSGDVEDQLEKIQADPGTKAVVEYCHSLRKEIPKISAVVDNVIAPVTFDQVQEATRDAAEAVEAWEARHDTSAARKRTKKAIDALEESAKRLGIQATFLMTFRHPDKTRHVAMELQNVQQALKAELGTLANVDPMTDAPLEEVRRALANTISFYTCTVENKVSRLQKAVKDLSSSLSRHVPGLSAPDTSQVTKLMKNFRQNKRKREDLERDLERIREDANDGDAEAQTKIPGLKQELAQIKSVYKMDSELRNKRARVLRHAEEHYPELLRDQEWLKRLGVSDDGARLKLSKLGLWLANAKREDFETLEKLASKPGKTVLKVRDLNDREFVLKTFHLADEEWSSRFYHQVAALAQIKSDNIVRIQGVFMQDAHQGCALMPFYSGGNLAIWIRDNPHADLAMRRRIAIGLLSGLHDLHSQSLVHCDLKPENVFLTQGLLPVLGDIGGVPLYNVTLAQPVQATLKYMAPELCSGCLNEAESAVDLFSAGMVLGDLYEGSGTPDAMQSLISSLQSADPTQRPTALEALRHEALRHEAFKVEPV
ncbi:Ankyrin-2 [Hondaea fermentalgiana]|uniref:Ankyrin-2 n=1 Tax=Hondaea fermentalgiana TaxID=2315210 RepID=A0A2R5G2S7_9STRA|nr:Ankyrin-2 [Hondaea fermentalgiana]|eukprot:GBG24835.1 Ankyrin-2 [Hondaea fermentalgiana]